jgi:CRISPR-associated protein Csb2
MLTISVELLTGTYRADPDGSVMMGGAVTGEWPPSPARLLAAFIAADGTRERCTATTGSELKKLAAAPPPIVFADTSPCKEKRLHIPIEDQFVVTSAKGKNTVQEFPGRQATVKRSGVKVVPRHHIVQFLYDLTCDRKDLKALQYRAARIGYLGCSDSPVRIHVSATAPTQDSTLGQFTPDKEGSLRLSTHRAGDVDRWDALYDQSRMGSGSRGQRRTLRHLTRYRLPGIDPEPMSDKGRVISWLQFDRAVSGRRVAAVSYHLKEAVMAHYGRMYPYSTIPAVLHGHRQGLGFNLIRFLALPNVGHSYSDGRIHGAAVWLPPGVEPAEQARIRRAASAVDRIRVGTAHISVDNWDKRLGRRQWATNPYRWSHSSDVPVEHQLWATAFPVLLERHGEVTSSALNRMCANAGLPPALHFLESRIPFLPGGVKLAPPETVRPGHSHRRPYCHFLIHFGVPVPGPIALGAGRSYGLGLFAPVDLRTAKKELSNVG